MQRRCTQSACRRVFPIGHNAPVQCPYCGTVYPRIQPDSRSPRDTFGYSVRVDFTGMPNVEVRSVFPDFRGWPCYFRRQPLAVGYGLSLRDAREYCRRFHSRGISADIITSWDAQRQHLVFFRI